MGRRGGGRKCKSGKSGMLHVCMRSSNVSSKFDVRFMECAEMNTAVGAATHMPQLHEEDCPLVVHCLQ